jgi:small subunit ribosomal protein S1
VHQGRISRLAAFGAFVTLEPGIDGLLHISRLGAGRRIHHPREVVETGQELTVKIEAVDSAQKRIALVPEDYTPSEKEEKEMEVVRLTAKEQVSMGTLGDLLKKQLKKK